MQKVFIQMKTHDAPAFAEGIWLKRQNKSQNWASNPNGNELSKMCIIRRDYDGFFPYHPVFTRRQGLICMLSIEG